MAGDAFLARTPQTCVRLDPDGPSEARDPVVVRLTVDVWIDLTNAGAVVEDLVTSCAGDDRRHTGRGDGETAVLSAAADSLAMTGASISRVAAAGLGLALMGSALRGRRRRV